MRTRISLWVASILLAAAWNVSAIPKSQVEKGMEEILAVAQELPYGADPTPPIKEVFEKNFGGLSESDISTLSDDDLRFYLSAADLVLFFSNDSEDLARLDRAFKLLEARGAIRPFDFDMMFKAFIQLRDLDAAAGLAARHPEFAHESLPALQDLVGSDEGPSILRLESDDKVSRIPAGLAAHGPQVVVAAHPLCHFSENAVRAIDQDPELAGLFAGRTLWLMPQDGHLNVDVVREWNRQFPDYTMRWAWRTSDWPMIKRWATPNFYFYRDGKLVDTVIGWPPEGQREALLSAFEKIGVAPAQAP